jgi:ribonuclease HII
MIDILPFYNDDKDTLEIGVDEAGRGPLFGRVYTAAVILPKEGFDYSRMKDSKRFHSEKKIQQEESYIKENAIAWNVSYNDEKRIDSINILQATIESMHNSIKNVTEDTGIENNFFIIVDGNYFQEYTYFYDNTLGSIDHTTVKGGDDKYASIAAASILAKCARDRYIKELCELHPLLNDRYNICSNKGYGAKIHINGIKQHGISQFHRLSYKTCHGMILNPV